MIERYVRRFTISTQNWGDVLVLRTIPIKGDPWGPFACLKDTWWENQIPIINGEVFSHALHGHAQPLMRTIGPDPQHLLRKYKEPCLLSRGNRCVLAGPNCFPHATRKTRTPECYVPPLEEEGQQWAAGVVVQAWTEGRYVLVVEGEEFSLG